MNLNHPPLTAAELYDWLRLIRSENVGPATFWRLIQQYGNASASLEALPELAQRGGMKRKIKIASHESVDIELSKAQKLGARYIAHPDNDYPSLLRAISSPPPVLCIKGHSVLFEKRMIGIVGARNASAVGNRLARELGQDLANRDITVVSGLARGIDTAAHVGSLSAGTVAVLAGGIDHIYPPENEELYHQIANNGAIVTELPLGVRAQARDFPRRNRIISGISLGVIVIEASRKSGSLITANYALEQNREVFAVPGSPLDPRAKGTNHLIREGATLIENADHVMEVIEGLKPLSLNEPDDMEWSSNAPDNTQINEAELAKTREVIHQLLGPAPIAIDELIRQSGTMPGQVRTVLLELELAGRLEVHTGGMVSLI